MNVAQEHVMLQFCATLLVTSIFVLLNIANFTNLRTFHCLNLSSASTFKDGRRLIWPAMLASSPAMSMSNAALGAGWP